MRFLTLRVRTFLFMLLNLLLAFLLTGAFSLYHFRAENEDYHSQRLERKERAIISHLEYVLNDQDTLVHSSEEWRQLLEQSVQEIGSIHKLDIALFHPDGSKITEAISNFENTIVVPDELISYSQSTYRVPEGRMVESFGDLLVSTKEVVTDLNTLVLVVKTYYRVDKVAIPEADLVFLKQLVYVYLFLLLLGVLMAFVLSNYISQNMKRVVEQLKKFRLNQRNEKLDWRFDDEIGEVIQQYNLMVDKLEQTAVELAKSERESAWKEMAQQVAHEIKNPLTPMSLTLQLMEREDDVSELREMASNLLEEIQNLSHIAEAFSRFAQMPGLRLEKLDISYHTTRAVSLYVDQGVSYEGAGQLFCKIDREQWSRIIHNLVKNALQSIPDSRKPDIQVRIKEKEDKALITVSDNGEGIPDSMKERVFEPNFTTKSSGMGLGLAMVKNLIENFGGAIRFSSTEKGTTFIIELPITD